jgi:molecular chaperone GrpE
MMEGSDKKESLKASESSGEEHEEKISEQLPEGKHQKNKKKKEDKEKEVEELKKKLEEKEKEAKENYDRLLRMAADFENYKKRAAKEKEEWTKFANEDLLKGVLPFIDNLERAVNHAQKVNDTGVLIEGVRLTLQQLLQSLSKFGLSSFESTGKPFDPAVHEAMLVVETDQYEPNQVIEEFQKGYLLNDRLLRPATVSVSKPLEKEALTSE